MAVWGHKLPTWAPGQHGRCTPDSRRKRPESCRPQPDGGTTPDNCRRRRGLSSAALCQELPKLWRTMQGRYTSLVPHRPLAEPGLTIGETPSLAHPESRCIEDGTCHPRPQRWNRQPEVPALGPSSPSGERQTITVAMPRNRLGGTAADPAGAGPGGDLRWSRCAQLLHLSPTSCYVINQPGH